MKKPKEGSSAPPATPEEKRANELWAKRVKGLPPQKCRLGQPCDFDRIAAPERVAPNVLLSMVLCPEHQKAVHAARRSS